MNNYKIIIPIFILVAIAQIYVPAKMIIDNNDVLHSGKEYRFRAAPIDPSDPFRGKYIILDFEETSISVKGKTGWDRNQTIYVLLEKDSDGFAKIKSVSKNKPSNTEDFVKAKVSYFSSVMDSGSISIEYPFEKYYMEESKAPAAEKVYRESLSDTSNITYALVNIKDGESVLKDVLINGISISEVVKRSNQ